MNPADTSAVPGAPPSEGDRGDINARVWGKGALVYLYTRRRLRPAERVLFERHRDALSGRVLELGCGGGRLTGHLIAIAETVTGIDIAASMVEYCRKTYPDARFLERDMRDLDDLESGGWTAIVAGFNGIDVLGDRERRALLDELHRLLAPGGALIFSTHNLASAPLIKPPLRNMSFNPVRTINRIVRLPRAIRNRRRLSSLQYVADDHAILNDVAHDYSLLHYYISRDGQERQLGEHGFELLECVDLDGAPVTAGQSARGCHELHYAARRSG